MTLQGYSWGNAEPGGPKIGVLRTASVGTVRICRRLDAMMRIQRTQSRPHLLSTAVTVKKMFSRRLIFIRDRLSVRPLPTAIGTESRVLPPAFELRAADRACRRRRRAQSLLSASRVPCPVLSGYLFLLLLVPFLPLGLAGGAVVVGDLARAEVAAVRAWIA